MYGEDLRFTFEAGEYRALQELARKCRTNLESILRIGGQMVLEADRLGLFKLGPARAVDALRKEPN